MSGAQGYVLLTRPLAESRRLAHDLEKKGRTVLIAPSYEIVPLPPPSVENIQRADGFIITSSHTVQFLPGFSDEVYLKPVFAIGDKTRKSLQKTRFRNIFCAKNSSVDLARLIKDYNPNEGALFHHLGGRHVSKTLQKNLERENIAYRSFSLYEARKAEKIPPNVLSELHKGNISQVLFFSERAALIFEELSMVEGILSHLSQTQALCLAESVVKSLTSAVWKDIYVAEHATEEALLQWFDRLG